MIALNAKNKMKLITGAFPEPSMESELRAIWERNNDMLISWILNTLKQENCSVEVYYHKLKGFWDEYDALEAPYMCICLDEGYSNIRGQILLMQPLPSAAKAYTMVRQEEKQRETSNPKHQTYTILNSYTSQSRPSTSNSQRYNPPRQPIPSNNSERRNTAIPNTSYDDKRNAYRKGVYYGNCGKEGHYQEECYKIVGYPVGHPLRGKYQPSKVTRPTQDNRLPRTINMAIGQDNSRQQASAIPQNSPNNDGHGNISQGIFSSHCIKIPKFIATLITDLKDAWIIDSGAIDHDQNKRIAHGTLCDGLYFISPTVSSCKTPSTILHSSTISSPWHSRLGHSSFTVLKKIKPLASLFKLAINKNWFIEQLDINNAFLHGDLHEEVYMAIRQGYSTTVPSNTVCRLKKSLYGLKQANKQWFTKLTDFYLSDGIT
ncbi:cysteine-rich receptor-like protein kinase 8 [Tanacetum coccineum]